ncbi:MAG: potassium channel family protein [Clostridiaceae bacterium]|nr:potassium channel family protein [Clostridiaceae bacterium]
MDIYIGILIVGIIFVCFFGDKKIIYKIKKINNTYRELFLEKNLLIRIPQLLLVFLAEIMYFSAIYIAIITYINENYGVNFILEFLLICFCFLSVHYSMGYLLHISSNINVFMREELDKSLRAYFLLSYFLTSSYLLLVILLPEALKTYALSGLISLVVCYICNMKILFRFMKNPGCIKFSFSDRGSFTKVFIAVMTLLVMIVFNLYLGVCLANSLEDGAFSNNPSSFDLFYYTIVTFATIGFGDIIPISIPAKIMAIVIAGTSVICLTVFLGSIFTIKQKNDKVS